MVPNFLLSLIEKVIDLLILYTIFTTFAKKIQLSKIFSICSRSFGGDGGFVVVVVVVVVLLCCCSQINFYTRSFDLAT